MPCRYGVKLSSAAPLSDKRPTNVFNPKFDAISWNSILTKMRDEADVSSSVKVIACRHFQWIEFVYIKWAKKHAKFRNLLCSSLCTLSY